MYAELNKGEQRVARRLVKAALAEGYSIAVHDGEEWSPRSTTFYEIWDDIGETDEDQMLFFDATGTKVGWMLLVWGNDPDGEELIADHTANVAMGKLADAALKRKSGE